MSASNRLSFTTLEQILEYYKIAAPSSQAMDPDEALPLAGEELAKEVVNSFTQRFTKERLAQSSVNRKGKRRRVRRV